MLQDFYSVSDHFGTLYIKRLSLVSAIFCQIFIFHQIIALQKLLKMFFYFILKPLFILEIFKFCIFVFPSFFPCQPLL